MPLWSELSRSRPTILNQKRKRAPNKRSASDCLDHPLTLPEQVRPALQEECTGHLLSLRTIGYDCVFPRGYIPSRGKIRAIRVETGKSAVLAKVTWDQEPEDSWQPEMRGAKILECGGVLFQKYTGSSLSLFYKKKAKKEKTTSTPMRFGFQLFGVLINFAVLREM